MEERRFDDLTRALGQGASRRTVLKGLLGAAVGGVLASVGVRAPRIAEAEASTCNGVPYDPSSQCCEAAGIQPMYPIKDLDLCPNRVPHPGHVPSFNGCGPAQGWIRHIIPNKIGPYRNIDFTPACNNHDICYDTCNSDKSECDSAFVADMTAACKEAYPGRGSFDRYMRMACMADAYGYYTAVAKTAKGTQAYESAQKQACDCCSNCSECGGPGDERCCNGSCHDSCPEGKTRNPNTCGCVCSSTCPPGQHQDPETCQCTDLCAEVTCSTCHSCDPDTGECVVSGDASGCGDGECCNGACVSPCSNGEQRDPTTCQCGCVEGLTCGTDCCTDNQECCNEQCVNVCPPGQRRDPSSCQCVCDSGEACGPYCCSGDKVCCPDTLSGMSCRDPQGACGCGVPCGGMCCGQYEYCCIAADDSFHCVGSSGDSC